MEDVFRNGFTYEMSSIQAWFKKGKTTSPRTGAILSSTAVVPNINIKQAVAHWKESCGGCVGGAGGCVGGGCVGGAGGGGIDCADGKDSDDEF